jgi:Mce-associated membrane protein
VVEEAKEPVVEETDATAEATTPVTAEVPAEPVMKRRRRKILRRRKNEPEATTPIDSEEDAPPQAEDDTAEETAAAESVETTEGEAAESVETTEGEAADAKPDEPKPVLVPHRPAGKRLKTAAAAAAVLFVAGGAFLAATAQPVIANNALVETKLNIARTAANAITTLWSYTPDDMDSLGERSARYLTGDFAAQYTKFIDSIVATNKQAQVTNTTSVLGTAVESVSAGNASAVVYTNSVATSPVSKNIPSLRYLSYRLEMKRDRAEWRITRMTTITTLDLTPQL